MDDQLHTLVLQMLQQTADGLSAAIKAPIREIETGGEAAERLQSRMELTIKRIGTIIDVMQGVASPEQLQTPWEDREDEQEYQKQLHQMVQGQCDYVRATSRDGSTRTGYLIDVADGVGTLLEAETNARTTVNLAEVVLDVLLPGRVSVLARYPFEKDDVIIFRDGQDQLQGRFARPAREGGVVVFVGNTLLGVLYSDDVRVRKLACDFHVPPAHTWQHRQIAEMWSLLQQQQPDGRGQALAE